MSGRALVLAIVLLAVPAAARQTIGIYKGWGAFRDPDRCYAIAQPVLANGRPGGFATVGTWPAKRLRASFHLHLSAPRDRAAPVTLAIGERRFPLIGTDRDVWAPDGATDHALVMAMRSGRSMSVSAVDTRHRPFADTYALAGAAAAIDAATLACVAGNPG
ncbi:invasion associated locus B family protein [Sphingomonas paucimobilis]|uniref:invasion associated locus B family protein n=1 Tax=Sphingomonas paucimobilis TaxID=13689 RepID=UPI0028D57A29|nr:invasion associated locus B family protein [Sphingomonas paucimobilis]